jgi:hypothetical protein
LYTLSMGWILNWIPHNKDMLPSSDTKNLC